MFKRRRIKTFLKYLEFTLTHILGMALELKWLVEGNEYEDSEFQDELCKLIGDVDKEATDSISWSEYAIVQILTQLVLTIKKQLKATESVEMDLDSALALQEILEKESEDIPAAHVEAADTTEDKGEADA